MKMRKKTSLVLLITFVFICLISVNSFATYETNNQAFNQPVQQPQQNQGQTTQLYTNISEPVVQQPQNTENQTPSTNQKVEGDEALPTKQKTELLNLKEQSRTALEKYKEKYKNNYVYGVIAYVLNAVRLASVPFFVIGILISVVYEYIIGMKRREMVRKGRGMRITMGSVFVTLQVLPLIFAIVIKFWGN